MKRIFKGRKEVPFGKNRGFLMQRILQKRREKTIFGLSINIVICWKTENSLHMQSNPQNLQLPEFSDSIWRLIQVAYQFNKHIRAYFGGENLTGYQQTNPILDAQNPLEIILTEEWFMRQLCLPIYMLD